MRRLLLNPSSRKISSSCQNDCLAAGLRPDLLSELRCFPYLIFRPQHHQKGLAAGLRPDPLGELERSPWPPSTVGAMEGNTLAAVKGASHTSFSHHKITINVWRPGSARTCWGSLSAPPDSLAANVAASRPRGGKLFPSHCFPHWFQPQIALCMEEIHRRGLFLHACRHVRAWRNFKRARRFGRPCLMKAHFFF